MTRLILPIILIFVMAFSCVKPKTKDPKPTIEYKDFASARKSEFTNQDTAVLVLGYEDGDGDIFLDNISQGPNVIFTPWYYNTTTEKFEVQINTTTQDTQRITASIKQPDNGYYKNKSIKGDIYLPMSQYRPNDNVKIIKFTGFVVDVKGNKSNAVASPIYTLNF